MVWNREEQGLFLAVSADQMRFPRPIVERMGTKGAPKEGEAPPPFRLTDLEANLSINSLIVRRVGRVTVLVPKEMVVLDDKPSKPDPYAGLNASDRMRYLIPMLEPAQLRKLFGPAGLGINDLTPKQRPLFEGILPAPGARIQKDIRSRSEDGTLDWKVEEISLTPAQISRIRLRFSPRLNWWFGAQNGASLYNFSYSQSEDAPGKTQIQMSWSQPALTTPPAGTLFGVPVLRYMPERLKPGQLPWDWEVLNRTVSLDGVQTLGDIVDRVRKTTGAQDYADRRYAVRVVALRGTEAKASDLLKALCHSVHGTFRRVGDIFVLTDDIEGLGTRHARIWRWYEEAVREANAIDAAAEAAIGKQDLAQYLDWSGSDPATDPYAPDEKLRSAMQAYRERNRKWKSGEEAPPEGARSNPRQFSFWAKIKELPPAMQGLVRVQMENNLATIQQANITTDQINLTLEARPVMIVPGVGELPAAGFYGATDHISYMLGAPEFPQPNTSAANPEPVPMNRNVPRRVLIVAPKNGEEAMSLVRHAAAKGFTAVWVEVPADDNGIVEAALQAGKGTGVEVGAVVQVLRRKAGNTKTAERNILGETGSEFADFALRSLPGDQHAHRFHHHYQNKWFSDPMRTRRSGEWQSPQVSEVRKQAVASVQKIASLPGLKALALRDYAPDGYREFVDRSASQETIGLWQPGDEYGYSDEVRAEFIRRYGADPMDLSPLFESRMNSITGSYRSQDTQLSLPLFPDWGPPSPMNPVDQHSHSVGSQPPGLLKASVELHRDWNEFRRETAQTFLVELVDSVRQQHDDLPLYGLRAGSVVWLNEPYRMIPLTDGAQAATALLPKPVVSPNGQINQGQPQQTAANLPGFRVWTLPPMETGAGTSQTFRTWLGAYFSRSKDVQENGIAVDLTGFSADTVQKLLTENIAKTAQPAEQPTVGTPGRQ
ncbi:MAG: hypothetical protein OHK0029_32570 [Armatimonadaceae bacterium]